VARSGATRAGAQIDAGLVRRGDGERAGEAAQDGRKEEVVLAESDLQCCELRDGGDAAGEADLVGEGGPAGAGGDGVVGEEAGALRERRLHLDD